MTVYVQSAHDDEWGGWRSFWGASRDEAVQLASEWVGIDPSSRKLETRCQSVEFDGRSLAGIVKLLNRVAANGDPAP